MSLNKFNEPNFAKRSMTRRQFIYRTIQGASALYLSSVLPAEAIVEKQSLSFHHTHTGETLSLVYKQEGCYLPEALQQINYLLRDFRTEEAHPIDPSLLDILYALQQSCGGHGTFEIISGYRSLKTNNMLRKKSGGVAKRSLHMLGKAVDIRLTGMDTYELRNTALKLKRGGVGYYRRSDFVHIDTGRVRTW